MLKKVHSSHIGVESCLQKTCDVLFRAGMSVEIKYSIPKCDPSTEHVSEKPAERTSDTPWSTQRAWSHVATDLLTFDEKEWSIIVDYWSDYLLLNQLPDSQVSIVIKSLKNQFACHAIPDTLYGPQFASREFKEFAAAWHFDHQKSSAYYSQSNGRIKNAKKPRNYSPK